MGRFLLTSLFVLLSSTSWAMREQGEFNSSQCGKAPWSATGYVKVCFGSIIGAPIYQDNNVRKALVYMQVGGSNYVGQLTGPGEPQPTQPIYAQPETTTIEMSQIAEGDLTPKKGAQKIKVKIEHQGRAVISAEVTMPTGKVIKAEHFEDMGGAI